MLGVGFRWLGGLLALPLLLCWGGCPPRGDAVGQPAGARYRPVFLVRTEGLAEPAVKTGQNVCKPVGAFDIDPLDAAAGQAVGFFVTLAADAADTIQARLVDTESQASHALQRLNGPANAEEEALAAQPRPFNDAARQALRTGRPLLWHDGSAADGLEHRFGVLVPQALLGAYVRLDLYAAVADDGTPIGMASLELVQDFFYLAIIGDSVHWGNGLPERDKISALTIEAIERETRRKVIWQRYAVSGARIVPEEGEPTCAFGCGGEVPTAQPSITGQTGLIAQPAVMDLILMDGCINDVGVLTILNPETTDQELTEATQLFCDQEMATLLRRVRTLAPQARIVVTGYFQFVGPESNLPDLDAWTLVMGLNFTEQPDIVAELAHQSALFLDVAHTGLRAAIERVNQEDEGAWIAFADPAFGPERAVCTPDSWLWSLTSDSTLFEDLETDLDLFPEDPLRLYRLNNCLARDIPESKLMCIYASVGHPNPTGARIYAEAVVAALRELNVLPPVE